MLGLCEVALIGTIAEQITCRSHNGILRSLCNLHGIHHILHSPHSRSRARPRLWVQHRPHACHSSPCCIQDRILHSLRIHHGILRIHRIRSKAQPQSHACHSSPCCIQDRILHSLRIHHGSLRIHRIHSPC